MSQAGPISRLPPTSLKTNSMGPFPATPSSADSASMSARTASPSIASSALQVVRGSTNVSLKRPSTFSAVPVASDGELGGSLADGVAVAPRGGAVGEATPGSPGDAPPGLVHAPMTTTKAMAASRFKMLPVGVRVDWTRVDPAKLRRTAGDFGRVPEVGAVAKAADHGVGHRNVLTSLDLEPTTQENDDGPRQDGRARDAVQGDQRGRRRRPARGPLCWPRRSWRPRSVS